MVHAYFRVFIISLGNNVGDASPMIVRSEWPRADLGD